MNPEENRNRKRDKQRAKRRYGPRGGTGKRIKQILDVQVKRAEEIKEQKSSTQQPTKP